MQNYMDTIWMLVHRITQAKLTKKILQQNKLHWLCSDDITKIKLIQGRYEHWSPPSWQMTQFFIIQKKYNVCIQYLTLKFDSFI